MGEGTFSRRDQHPQILLALEYSILGSGNLMLPCCPSVHHDTSSVMFYGIASATLLRYPCHHAPSLSELVHPPHHLWMSPRSDWAATSPFSGRNLEASSPVPTDQNWQWHDNTTIS